MERKRVGGRFARAESGMAVDDDGEGVAGGTRKTAVRSRHSRAIGKARRELVDALTEVATKLAMEAKAGSIPHMKLLLQLLGLEDGGLTPKERSKREKSLEEIVMEQWRKEP
jgi:hypothetical protein